MMNDMKRIANKIFLLGFFLLCLPSVVFADEAYEAVISGLNTAANTAGFTTTGSFGVINLISTGINLTLSLTGLIFLVLVIYSGVNLMLAQGDATKIKKSKDILINAAIGIVLILGAYALTTFIFNNILPSIVTPYTTGTGTITSSTTTTTTP